MDYGETKKTRLIGPNAKTFLAAHQTSQTFTA
ncbi:hypothetical protein CCACVL1_18548 [Corchorus capsularis]|uniref:Uncharacterized protein n=1 Tax=Corchorus capsularis TaxID=210143 RepID=A0A1R3HKQ0_COCAP|nr:hypothetical protein CCACVL1_18548 [Corchorus capsularis]